MERLALMLGAQYPGLCRPPPAVAVGYLSCQRFPKLSTTAALGLPLTGGKSPGVIPSDASAVSSSSWYSSYVQSHLLAAVPQFLDALILVSLFFHYSSAFSLKTYYRPVFKLTDSFLSCVQSTEQPMEDILLFCSDV